MMVVLVATEKDILIVGKIPTDGSDDTAITEEAEYNINFIEQQNQQKCKLKWKQQRFVY